MLEPNEFAFPSGDKGWDGTRGLSVREHFAVQVMGQLAIAQQLCSVGMPEHAEGYARLLPPAEAAALAVEYADALIAELNKSVAPVKTETQEASDG